LAIIPTNLDFENTEKTSRSKAALIPPPAKRQNQHDYDKDELGYLQRPHSCD
jgi:hypothetical protein